MHKDDVFRQLNLSIDIEKILEKLPEITDNFHAGLSVLNQALMLYENYNIKNIIDVKNFPKLLLSLPEGNYIVKTDPTGIEKHVDSLYTTRSASVNIAITTGEAPIRFYDSNGNIFFEHYYTPGEAVLLNSRVTHDVPPPKSPRYMMQFSIFNSSWEETVENMKEYIIS